MGRWALIPLDRKSVGSVGPAVGNANPHSATRWANLLIETGLGRAWRWQEPWSICLEQQQLQAQRPLGEHLVPL